MGYNFRDAGGAGWAAVGRRSWGSNIEVRRWKNWKKVEDSRFKAAKMAKQQQLVEAVGVEDGLTKHWGVVCGG